MAGAGEGGVDFILRQVLGAEEGEFLFEGRGGDGGVLEDYSLLAVVGSDRWVCALTCDGALN